MAFVVFMFTEPLVIVTVPLVVPSGAIVPSPDTSVKAPVMPLSPHTPLLFGPSLERGIQCPATQKRAGGDPRTDLGPDRAIMTLLRLHTQHGYPNHRG